MTKRKGEKLLSHFARAMRDFERKGNYSEDRLSSLQSKVELWLRDAVANFGLRLPACQATAERDGVKLFWENGDRAVVLFVRPLRTQIESSGHLRGALYNSERDVAIAEGLTRGPNIPGLGEWYSRICASDEEDTFAGREQEVTDGAELLVKLQWLLEERPRRRTRPSRLGRFSPRPSLLTT